MVEIFALVEQGARRDDYRKDYSKLTVTPRGDRSPTSSSVIETNISPNDAAILGKVRHKVFSMAERIAEHALDDVTISDERRDNIVIAVDDPHQRVATYADRDRIGSDPRMVSYDIAVHSVIEQREAGKVAAYHLPYGAVEHEGCTHPIGKGGFCTVTEDLEVEDLPGVYLAGPGSIVRPGAANTAMTIISISQRIAATLKARYA